MKPYGVTPEAHYRPHDKTELPRPYVSPMPEINIPYRRLVFEGLLEDLLGGLKFLVELPVLLVCAVIQGVCWLFLAALIVAIPVGFVLAAISVASMSHGQLIILLLGIIAVAVVCIAFKK
jgi:hypothetical protein